MISLYILYYVRNQCFNILEITIEYFAYINNTIKYIVENLYYTSILVIYKTI